MLKGLEMLSIKEGDITNYINTLFNSPYDLVMFIIDVTLVILLAVKFLQFVKGTRALQLLKGILFLIIATMLTSLLDLKILNFILTSFMTYGVILLIVMFQPELRRALEQLGSNKINRFFGIEHDIAAKAKENIYKIAIAATELSKTKTGALIVLERDININDIAETGVKIDAEVSPQLLVNLFTPKTPLHDGAIIISNNKIEAAACILPLANDADIAKELGTRHRAGLGISKETDAIAVIVSEETGKISIAKDGNLIVDVKEEALRNILIKNIITKRYEERPKRKLFKFNKKVDKNKVKDNETK